MTVVDTMLPLSGVPDGDSVYVRTGAIESVYRTSGKHGVTRIGFASGAYAEVRETPDEVMDVWAQAATVLKESQGREQRESARGLWGDAIREAYEKGRAQENPRIDPGVRW